MSEAEKLIARADKYLNTGSGEYASEIMRDMAEFIRRLPSVNAVPALLKALEDAEESFEVIRIILVNNLTEPERGAFWNTVKARDAIRAALAAYQGGKI